MQGTSHNRRQGGGKKTPAYAEGQNAHIKVQTLGSVQQPPFHAGKLEPNTDNRICMRTG